MAIPRKLAQGVVLAVAIGLVAVLAAGMLKGKARQEEPQNPAPAGESKTEAGMKLTDMDYTEMQGGKRVWTLKASEAKYFQDTQKSMLSGVHLTLYLDSGDEILLDSREGMLSAGSKDIDLWGEVKAMLPNGYELTTERASYRHQQRTVSSDTIIHLNGPDAELQGERWEYRIPERRAIIEGGVQASVVLSLPDSQTSQ